MSIIAIIPFIYQGSYQVARNTVITDQADVGVETAQKAVRII